MHYLIDPDRPDPLRHYCERCDTCHESIDCPPLATTAPAASLAAPADAGQGVGTICGCDTQITEGITSEGCSYTLIAHYAPGAPDGALPLRITGSYASLDGGGCIDVTSERDLPHVIAEGYETRRYPVQLWLFEERRP